MGCTSSKVGQKPLDEHDPKFTSSEAMKEEPRSGTPTDSQQRASVESARARVAPHVVDLAESEQPGSTLKDDSGLLMRTPRRSSERSLSQAAKCGDLALVREILDEHPGKDVVDERGLWGNTPLLVATQYAQEAVALALLDGGADPSTVNERRATPLHYACAEGLEQVARALLDSGAEVDPPPAAIPHPRLSRREALCLTPLIAASTMGYCQVIRMLLEHGAQVDRFVYASSYGAADDDASSCGGDEQGGLSALMAAASHGHDDACLVMIDNGASICSKVHSVH